MLISVSWSQVFMGINEAFGEMFGQKISEML